MRILVLFDGSENAMRAVNFAGKIAKVNSEAEITVLQVVEFWETGAWGFLTLPDEEQRAAVAKAKQQAAEGLEKASKVLAGTGVQVETVTLVGEPVATIIDYAGQAQPDVIVMGSRGMGPVRELVLGGICHKVLQLAKQPVVVVK
ncbi:MAG: universal stress protein [Firmicutes bacterium]|nr:universal stress protein [Bacillota bacterium]